MPINSFDDYPMSWTPDKGELTFPIYRSLADLMERDIKSGKLAANIKLPPQRELADYLDLNLSTVTKAYKLCEMRGLIHAITGKGTFVAPYANVLTSTVEKITVPRIELAIIHPFYESNAVIRDLTVEILKKPFSEQLFEYSHPLGDRGQIATAVRWLKRFGLEADEHNTMIAAEIIRSGLAGKIIQKKRAAAMERNRIYASCFPGGRLCMESYYQWLELPKNCTGRLCEAQLSYQGVSVFGAERFSVGNQVKANAVRIATGSAENDEQLCKGLKILQDFIREQGNAEPAFIV